MRFKIISVVHTTDSESDYETAVDIAHWQKWESTYILESPAGLQLQLTARTEHTRMTYLEPDFDHFDATGNIVYVEHGALVQSPNERPSAEILVDVADVEGAACEGEGNARDSDSAEDLSNETDTSYEGSISGTSMLYEMNPVAHLNFEDFERECFAADECSPAGGGGYFDNLISLPRTDARMLLSQLDSVNAKEGTFEELILFPSLVDLVTELTDREFTVLSQNFHTRIENSCRRALFMANVLRHR